MEKHHDSVRMLTLNTWKGDGDYDWRRQLMARELSTLMPDILCLQEVLRTDDGRFDTAGYLADFLGLDLIHTPARKKVRRVEGYEHESTSGLAILSSFPISHHWVDRLEPHPKDHDRIALTARIAIGTHLLTVTNLHLTHIRDEQSLRLRQLRSLIDSNRQMAVDTAWFCCGDFNMPMEKTVRNSLREETGMVCQDCYLDGGGIHSATTLAHANATDERSRIDHIFHLHPPENAAVSCNNSRIVCDQPDFEGCYPSDHFGVSTDIHISTLPTGAL